MEQRTSIIELSWASLWRVFGFLIFVVIALIGKDILLSLFLALVISSGLESTVNFLERRGIPRTLGVVLLFLLGIILGLVVVYAVIPLIIIDLNNVISNLSTVELPEGLDKIVNFSAIESASQLINQISSLLFSGAVSPFAAISQVIGGVGLVVSIFITSFYLSITRDGVERFIRAVFPERVEERALLIYDRSRKKIGSWFRTQLLLSVIVGALVWVSMSLLGVRHAFLLGFSAAVLELVPIVGSVVAGGAAVITALSESVGLAFGALAVFVAIQQLESQFLVPILTRRSVGLHPVMVITALLLGIQVSGLLGALVAIPIAAVLQEVVEEWGSRKRARFAAQG